MSLPRYFLAITGAVLFGFFCLSSSEGREDDDRDNRKVNGVDLSKLPPELARQLRERIEAENKKSKKEKTIEKKVDKKVTKKETTEKKIEKTPPVVKQPWEKKPYRWAPEPPKGLNVKSPGSLSDLILHLSFDDKELDAIDGKRVKLHGGGWQILGVKGNALLLEGPGRNLELGDTPKLNFPAKAPFTIAGWFATQNPAGTLMSFRREGNGNPVIDLLINKIFEVHVRSDGGSEVKGAELVKVQCPTRVDDGRWHHFAVVRKADGQVAVYLDGALQGEARAPYSDGAINTTWRYIGFERFWVKDRFAHTDPSFSGAVDEFCFFSRALPLSEIRALAGRN